MGPAIRNFIWTAHGSHALDLESYLEGATTLHDTVGHFALHQKTRAGVHLLARDRLGVNKLFYAVDKETLVASNFWFELIHCGYAPDAIWSIPSGHFAIYRSGEARPLLQRYTSLQFGEDRIVSEREIPSYTKRIQTRLRSVFETVRHWSADRRIYVSLSGGLDSTAIAVLAREHLGEFTAVTFGVTQSPNDQILSEDLIVARRVAEQLGVPFKAILVSPEQVLEAVDSVLLYGQDWREFNVHCALVNAAIGRAIRDDYSLSRPTSAPLLLTGDVMNELMADYTPVQYKGKEYYPLPRLPVGRLRELLVAGLDSGDREVGIMNYYGVEIIQPYALCADVYAALPACLLAQARAKQDLARRVFGSDIPDYVYARLKTRAQEGTAGHATGTLAACIDGGIDSEWLKRRFGELYGIDPVQLQRFIRGGYYRFDAAAKRGK